MSAGRQEAIPLSYTEKLKSIYGIRAVIPRVWGYYFDESNLANFTVLALEHDSMPYATNLNLTLAQGHFPKKTEPGTAVIGRSVHDILRLDNRRTFSLFRPDLSLKAFEVTGVFNQQTDIP